MSNSIVAEAKESVAIKKAQAKEEAKANRTGNPWYINLVMWIFDSLATIAILGLAIIGAQSLIATTLSETVKIGIAALVVGLLATRLLERIFKR
jgi:flagellar biosynthesis component FlhA